jgi:F420-dependent methylenetetrahydromethanopterin dehydrogenase
MLNVCIMIFSPIQFENPGWWLMLLPALRVNTKLSTITVKACFGKQPPEIPVSVTQGSIE